MMSRSEVEVREAGWEAQSDVATIAKEAWSDAIPAATPTASSSATPPATYFISVLELATGETLGNDERLRAIAILEAHFAAGGPPRLEEGGRVFGGAMQSLSPPRLAVGGAA